MLVAAAAPQHLLNNSSINIGVTLNKNMFNNIVRTLDISSSWVNRVPSDWVRVPKAMNAILSFKQGGGRYKEICYIHMVGIEVGIKTQQ